MRDDYYELLRFRARCRRIFMTVRIAGDREDFFFFLMGGIGAVE